MVRLRTPPVRVVKTARFVYDKSTVDDTTEFLGTYDDNGKPVSKTIKGDPTDLLAAVGPKKRIGFPTSKDKIIPHQIKLEDGRTGYWFEYIDEESLKKENEEVMPEDTKKEEAPKEEKKKKEEAPIPEGK